MTASNGGNQAWLASSDDLAATIDPERLSECFDRHIRPDLCARLKMSARLQERLSGIISARFDLLPLPHEWSGNEGDKALVLASPDALTEIVSRAGAIYWSAAIAGTVLAVDVAALRDEIGDELCRFAVKHRDLAAPGLSLPPRDRLSEEISAAGWRCLAAWCETADPAIGARVRLKLPPHDILDTAVRQDFRERGPQIIRRAASA